MPEYFIILMIFSFYFNTRQCHQTIAKFLDAKKLRRRCFSYCNFFLLCFDTFSWDYKNLCISYLDYLTFQ